MSVIATVLSLYVCWWAPPTKVETCELYTKLRLPHEAAGQCEALGESWRRTWGNLDPPVPGTFAVWRCDRHHERRR